MALTGQMRSGRRCAACEAEGVGEGIKSGNGRECLCLALLRFRCKGVLGRRVDVQGEATDLDAEVDA